jgi:hypothetical protein
MSIWLATIDSTACCNNDDNNNTGIVLVEKGLQDCPASLEKGDIEEGNSEATPELLVFQWKKKSNKVV